MKHYDFVFTWEYPLFLAQYSPDGRAPDFPMWEGFNVANGEKILAVWSDRDAAETYIEQAGIQAVPYEIPYHSTLCAALDVAEVFGLTAAVIDPTSQRLPPGWRRVEFDEFRHPPSDDEVRDLMVDPLDGHATD